MIKLNRTQAFLLAQVACYGPDYFYELDDRRAVGFLERKGLITIKRTKHRDDCVSRTGCYYCEKNLIEWQVTATEKGKKRILG